MIPVVKRCGRRDETDINIKGPWRYVYRAVDSAGNPVDFLLTASGLAFFQKINTPAGSTHWGNTR